MSEQTIAGQQAQFQQWYEEWVAIEPYQTPESLLKYFKTRLCVVFLEA